MKHIFIINPTAGKADATQAVLAKIEAVSHRLGDYAVEITQGPGHATQLARQYCAPGEPVWLWCCGGDGTLNEVVQGAYPYPNAQVVPMPFGSGNDLVKNFGVRSDFLDLEALLDGEPVVIDLIEVGERICISICSVGLDAAVAMGIDKYRRFPMLGGHMSYTMSIAENLLKPIGNPLTIHIDDRQLEGEYLLACIANGSFYGGGFHSAPVARMDDGMLDVILVPKLSRLRIASILSLYKTGNHFVGEHVDPKVARYFTYAKAKEIHITSDRDFISNVDGECGPAREFHMRVLPGAATLVIPAALAQRYKGFAFQR